MVGEPGRWRSHRLITFSETHTREVFAPRLSRGQLSGTMKPREEAIVGKLRDPVAAVSAGVQVAIDLCRQSHIELTHTVRPQGSVGRVQRGAGLPIGEFPG